MSLIVINRLLVLYLGLFFFIVGFFGSIMQVLILFTTPYYRKTPCTFYFIIASIHECGLFLTILGPIVVAACLDVDMTRVSVVWCKLRYFFNSGFGAIPLTCACLATIDLYLITSNNSRFRQWSNIKYAYRLTTLFVVIWWLHGTLWLYFQDLSSVTGVCVYITNAFFIYAIFFMCIIICGLPISIMMTFGILAYRNIRNITILSRLRIDRQFIIIVFVQIMLTLIGLSPYGIDSVYAISTIVIPKSADRKAREALVANITYIFGSLAYGGRFYLFIYSSSRFRRIVKDRILWWRRPRQVLPLVQY